MKTSRNSISQASSRQLQPCAGPRSAWGPNAVTVTARLALLLGFGVIGLLINARGRKQIS